MEKIKDFLKDRLVYFIYSFLFLIMILAVYRIFIQQGKSFIWYRDGLKQHYLFLYDFNEIIRNIFQNGFNTFSLNIGLGLDVIGQYTYYVIGDPFVILSFFFPMNKLHYAYSVMIIARIFCVGLAYIFFCRYKKKDVIPTLLGAIIYSFCGYVVYAGIRHPYFINALILLPLLFVGIEKLIKEDKKIFLTFMIFIAAVSNYYFLYILTILSVIYGIVTYIFDVKEKTAKGFFILLLKAAICYIIGIFMSAIIFVPSILAFTNSARVEASPIMQYKESLYENFLLSYVKISATHWTSIQVSIICIPIVGLLLCKWKENKKLITFLLINIIMLLVPIAGSIMNGFSYPTNRWSFMSSFILAYIVTSLYKPKFDYTIKELCFMGIFSSIFINLIYMTMNYTKSNSRSVYINTILLTGIIVLFILNYFINNKKILEKIKIIKAINYKKILYVLFNLAIIIIVCTGIYYNANFYFKKNYIKQFEKYSNIDNIYKTENEEIKNFKEAIDYIKENDNSVYRIAKYPVDIYNSSVLYNYNGISSFYSISNKYLFDFANELELNDYSQTSMKNVDNRTNIIDVLGVKYFICDKNNEQYVPYGFSLYKSIEDTNIYLNDNYLSLGIFYNQYIKEEQYDSLSSLEKQNALLEFAKIDENIEEVQQGDIQNIKDNIEELNYKIISNEKDKLEFEFENKAKGELYLVINNLNIDYKEIEESDYQVEVNYGNASKSESVNAKTSAYYLEKNNFVLNLGQVRDDNNKIELEFTHGDGELKYDNIKLYVIKNSSYDKQIEKLKETQLEDIKIDGNNISGKINNDSNGILQLSIPYSDGWQVFVDGEEQELLNINTGFIGVQLDEGEHNIEFKYHTPGLNLGIIISIIGIALFIGIIIYERKRSKNE